SIFWRRLWIEEVMAHRGLHGRRRSRLVMALARIGATEDRSSWIGKRRGPQLTRLASGNRFQRQNKDERRITRNGFGVVGAVGYCRRDHDDPRLAHLHAGRSKVEAGNHLA